MFFFQPDKGVDNWGSTGRIRVEIFPGRGCHVATNVLATNAQTADVFGELAEDKCVARTVRLEKAVENNFENINPNDLKLLLHVEPSL